jgi:hypothetical protein
MEHKAETHTNELPAFDVQATNPEFWPSVEPTKESLQRTFAFNHGNLHPVTKKNKQLLKKKAQPNLFQLHCFFPGCRVYYQRLCCQARQSVSQKKSVF